jgi:Zn-dependent protease with chaperone function
MPFLLLIFLALVCLPDLDELPPPAFAWIDSPAKSAALTWLAVAAAAAYARWASRRLARSLERHPRLQLTHAPRYEKRRWIQQAVLCGAYLLGLCVFGWGEAVSRFWQAEGWVVLPGAELVLLSPFLVGLLLSWAFFYDVERAGYRAAAQAAADDALGRALESGDASTLATPPPFLSRREYVSFQFRQKLALELLPLLLLIGQKELNRLIPDSWQQWQGLVNLGGAAAGLAVLLGMPWILRLMLGLRPLPAGPLRDRLLGAARRLRFHCSNILQWNTHQGMANALVIGLLPRPRYVVFTDKLLDEFRPDEVEAVFGHEVGHVKHHHMLYYLVFMVASIAALGLVVNVSLPELLQPAEGVGDPAAVEALGFGMYLKALPMVVFLLAYVFIVFGFLSRRCERQADIFGCRAVSCVRPDCTGHGPGDRLTAGGRGLCATGIRTFIRALEKVALVNGISRDRPGFLQSWRHSTIARRVEFLERVLTDPEVERRFQRRVALVKWALVLLIGAALGVLIHINGWSF